MKLGRKATLATFNVVCWRSCKLYLQLSLLTAEHKLLSQHNRVNFPNSSTVL
jgi:hypothetical protein